MVRRFLEFNKSKNLRQKCNDEMSWMEMKTR